MIISETDNEEFKDLYWQLSVYILGIWHIKDKLGFISGNQLNCYGIIHATYWFRWLYIDSHFFFVVEFTYKNLTWFLSELAATSFKNNRSVCSASLFGSGIRRTAACIASILESEGIPTQRETDRQLYVTNAYHIIVYLFGIPLSGRFFKDRCNITTYVHLRSHQSIKTWPALQKLKQPMAFFISSSKQTWFYLLEKMAMNVSASFDVKMGSGSSLKYCFSMSAMS